MRRSRRILALMASGASFLCLGASAQAAVVTVGSPMAATPLPGSSCPYSVGCSSINLSLPESGATVTSPVNGAIVRWRVTGTSALPGYAIRVFKREGSNLTGVGTSATVTPSGGAGIQTFTTDVPIQAGEYVGLNSPSGGGIGSANTGAKSGLSESLISDGTTATFAEFPGEILFNADVQPAPTIAAITPAAGSIQGGTSVAITGSNFTDVKAVSFGATPAQSFTVSSESQITATAPASATVTTAPISVTTIAGTAASPTAFSYEGCVVPKLGGKKLKASRKKAEAADCKIGKVTKKKGATAKTGRVKKQTPAAGKILPPGTHVKITLKP